MADTPQPTTVSCSFYDPKQSVVVEADIEIPTGLAARMIATREAAAKHALSQGWRWFASPATAEPDTRWLVFNMDGTMARYMSDWPTRPSAEMWMQHRAH